MIISPKIYAQALIEALEDGKNSQKVAKNFWNKLQKDKQYKNLPLILDALDEEYAKKQNLVLVKIISDYKLTENELKEIKQKAEKKLGKKASLKNIIKSNVGGIIVETDGKILDLSLSGKIQRLRKALNS